MCMSVVHMSNGRVYCLHMACVACIMHVATWQPSHALCLHVCVVLDVTRCHGR